jgi:hypothetical protein
MFEFKASDSTNVDDQVDFLKELLMKNLLGSQDPNFEGMVENVEKV